ncbi:MAG: polysaccharide biosynthesis tyrosine autokinase [Chitinispirillaceae bacterium]|nr:polysaccharide biosynthesis tyrosine autokinase [Chitinispirillaceae bacterium]
MQQQPAPPPTLREFDFGYYISHYSHLLWRWKLWIVVALPVAAAGFMLYLLKFGALQPELEAAVMIGLESSDTKSAVADLGESTQQSRLALIKAKGFLSEIVDKLSLRFQVKQYNLHEVFDSISVDTTAPSARYDLEAENGAYKLLMTSKEAGVKEKLVESGSLASLNAISFTGVTCTFARDFLKNPHNVTFYVVRQRDAIAWLLKNLTVYDKDIGRSYGREKDNFVGVSLTGRDYKRITSIINTIADEFVAKSLGFKKRKTTETIAVLEKQLTTASEQVATTQDAVRMFRGEHPTIALAAELQNSISNMAMLETNMYSSRSSSEEAQRIRNQLNAASEADQDLLINEALLFLSRQGVVAASVLQAEFNQLLQQQATLNAGYSKTHPQMIENRGKIADIRGKTLGLLAEYVKSAATTTYQQSNRIQEITARMQGLPVQQLQLAELERKAQVASEIHSTVLGRYNQAKISDAVEVPDVFIMDYAIEPEAPSDLKNLMKLFAIGLIAILGLSFGPPVAFDLFDKTARTESEATKFLPFTFMEAVPVIPTATPAKKREKKRKGEAPKTSVRLIDPKLVTASYTPDFTNEIFRSLRSKIMLRMHDIDKKRLIVTSLGMNEGKSLLAANLAITMAQQKLKTVLIDGDIRRGVQHNTFVLQKKPGLADFLFSEEAVTPDTIGRLIQPTHVPNLSIIASGPNVPNPSELLGLPRLEAMLDNLSTMFEIILLDTPPIGASVDAAVVGKFFNGAILIVKSGSTNVIALKKRLKEFPDLQRKITGIVLNRATLDGSMKRYRYYSYVY